jgi:hypothetical protein
MEEHKHEGEGSCMRNCWAGHYSMWIRALLAVLIIAFVFSAGVMIGRLGGSRGYQRGGHMKSGYGYRMMDGTTPRMYQFDTIQTGVRASVPTVSPAATQ